MIKLTQIENDECEFVIDNCTTSILDSMKSPINWFDWNIRKACYNPANFINTDLEFNKQRQNP